MLKNLPLTKILLSLAVISIAAVAAVGGTFANFTATPTTISSNAFASGSLTMSRSGSGANALDEIVDTATGSVTITNTGSLAGAYTLTGSSSGTAALANQLHLTLYKDADGGTAIYDGSLGGFSSVSLGTFSANGDAHTFYFHVSLPTTGSNTGDNALQGLSADESFTWSAVQA